MPRHRRNELPMTQATAADFDIIRFLGESSNGTAIEACTPRQVLFRQGDPSDAVFYIQEGRVKLTVVSTAGKEAVIAVLGVRSFFGEACLTGQRLRVATATALTHASIMRLDKATVLELLHAEPAFTELLMTYLLKRTVRIEEDLVDHLFNSCEKRLARTLLLLANFGQEGPPEKVIPKISQETLAEMIGTTRSRVSFFMNRFRRLGFITYKGAIEVHSSLLNVVLRD
jgi:CRP/FNR family transcriptional regulator, cyclic AMP receptor protein